MNTIQQYNQDWKERRITTPLVILIGGYAGTGKSTIAKSINEQIPFLNNFPTGIIRATLRDYISQEENPFLYSHTYDLYLIEGDVRGHYLQQCKPIIDSINQAIDFADSEKQMILFDGNHILPGLMNPQNKPNVIEIYLKVSDPNTHLKMLSGPTHNREMSEKQFQTARTLHDYVVQRAQDFNKPIFEYNCCKDEIFKIIEEKLKSFYQA
jgi:2-phosphoglycerate kinase